MYLDTIAAILIAYLIGSISSAVLACKLMGLPDPRKEGSGNPGATNVLRIGGKKAAIITLLADILKGVIPVFAAKWYGLDNFELSLVAFAAFLGHLYPIFFRFQGGKGVATAFGCLMVLSWAAGLSLVFIWLAMAMIFRYSSLASITAALLAPFCMWYFTQWNYFMMVCAISAFLIYRHRHNIQRLLVGKESKMGREKKP